MNVRNLIEENYLHFNAGELRDALRALEIHIEKGNKIFITLSGAISTDNSQQRPNTNQLSTFAVIYLAITDDEQPGK